MKNTLALTISRPQETCAITIQEGLLRNVEFFKQCFKDMGPRIVIVTHDGLKEMYGEPLRRLLHSLKLDVLLLSFPEGEQHKNRKTKAFLEDKMLEHGLGRDTTMIALGGGIVTDVAGFLAATYCRGLPLVMIPTTLLGMVDSSIGGKTAVNVPQGKNMIGCIYQPRAVLMDPAVLRSLPLPEIRNGMVEMIKHGIIANAGYFLELEKFADNMLALDPLHLPQAILESCRIKTTIVQEDEKDEGRRVLLNYGHTVGHALERLTDYSLSHGEAVAIGLIVEGQLSVELGFFKQSEQNRIKLILQRYGLPLRIPGKLTVEACLQAMAMDKKSRQGIPRFSLVTQIGIPHPNFSMEVDEKILRNTLQKMIDDLCFH